MRTARSSRREKILRGILSVLFVPALIGSFFVKELLFGVMIWVGLSLVFVGFVGVKLAESLKSREKDSKGAP